MTCVASKTQSQLRNYVTLKKIIQMLFFTISRNFGKNEGFLHSNIFKKKVEKILLPEFGNVPRKVHLEN